MSARTEAMIPATTSSAQYGSGRSPAGSAPAQLSRYRMAVVIHSVCADATVDQEPVERSSSSSSAFRC